MKPIIYSVFMMTILSAAASSAAQPAKGKQPRVKPLLVHAAPIVLDSAAAAYSFNVALRGAWAGTALKLHHRTQGKKAYTTQEFTQRTDGRWTAEIPGSKVTIPALEYFIQTVEADGSTVDRFATAKTPHVVVINPVPADRMHQVRLRRHNGKRATARLIFSRANLGQEGRKTSDGHTELLSDTFNTLETDLTYRFMRDAIYQIRFGYGMLGGKLGATSPDREWFDSPNVPESDKPSSVPAMPGLYYGFASAYWEFGDWAGLEAKVLMGASHRGFDGGAGVVGRLGTINGIHLDFGIEGISNVGFKFTTEFQWDTVKHTRMSLRAVVTDYPTVGRTAVISSYNLSLLLGEIELYGSLGYGLREGHETGGPVVSGGAAFNF